RLQGEAGRGDGIEVAPEVLERGGDGLCGGRLVVDLAEAMERAGERAPAGCDVFAREGRQGGGFAGAAAAFAVVDLHEEMRAWSRVSGEVDDPDAHAKPSADRWKSNSSCLRFARHFRPGTWLPKAQPRRGHHERAAAWRCRRGRR